MKIIIVYQGFLSILNIKVDLFYQNIIFLHILRQVLC